MPAAGIVLNLALFVYLMIFESFKEVHVACTRAAVLFAQFWLFVCASVANDSDEDVGSDMLGGWIVMLVIGYFLMLAKFLIFKRQTRKIPVEKN
mmetsp:Transcript_34771/g.6261  ORF Transcript_34771/g.6261 Transcript_34771/m.6261 type:complete len:94 (-) Transcript_34771:912-1193(-)